MREIKFRYIFEDIKGKKHTLTETVDELEAHLDIPHNIKVGWVLIARDEYTGLKDKNGEEIYEGDIVQWNVPRGSKAEVKFGEWDDGANNYEGGQKGYGWYLTFDYVSATRKGKKYTKTQTCSIIWGGMGFEVIGNVYENKELLEVSSEKNTV